MTGKNVKAVTVWVIVNISLIYSFLPRLSAMWATISVIFLLRLCSLFLVFPAGIFTYRYTVARNLKLVEIFFY